MSIDEDYYEPIIVRSAFKGNYIQYESRGDKGKNLSIKRYLKMSKPYLNDLINNHKTHSSARYHSGNKSWIEKTSSEWEIQLTMAIHFISSKDSDETQIMHTKSNNVEIKRLSALFRGITGNNNGDFYCLNCFQSYTTENKLKKYKKVCEIID